MHVLEPHFNWRGLYTAEDDHRSPFFGREYSEFEFTHTLYDHYLHPQWDEFGSSTLFMKLLYADYIQGVAIIEFIGEWNDCLNNDIMFLKRDIVEHLMAQGIYKFILIGENVLNFHYSDDCYYEEWFDEVSDENGWIAALNFQDHVIKEFAQANIDSYFILGGVLNEIAWRTLKPLALFERIEAYVERRLLST